MDSVNPTTSRNESPEQPNNGRRSFMWKIGGATAAVLASAVPAMSKTTHGGDPSLKSEFDLLSGRLGMLEAEKEIRTLHNTFESLLDKGMYAEVEDLFTGNAEVIFNRGVFKGRKGIHRLFSNHFKNGRTGRKMEPAPGFQLNDERQGMIEVAPDRKSARAGFAFSIQVGEPITSDSSLVKMARLQGEGIKKWWEGGVYELSYLKDAKGTWKINRLEYKTLSRADYTPGRSYAKPISTNPFSKVFPQEPSGPDKLIRQT